MDPIEKLINCAIHHELDLNQNPYVTLETIVLRLFKKISQRTHVMPNLPDKNLLFSVWHDEILSAYVKIRSHMSHDERSSVERVLSKDAPLTSELLKFATCWYKYDAVTACKWFAVDGILGNHPKLYIQDAFSTHFAKHNQAVRALYAYYSEPEKIKQIVEKAFTENEGEPSDPDFERCVGMYADMVGEEEMQLVSTERKNKLLQQQQQPNKRKRTHVPSSPQDL